MEPNELAGYLEQFSGEPEPETTASAPVVATVGYKGALRGRFATVPRGIAGYGRNDSLPYFFCYPEEIVFPTIETDEPEDARDEP